MAIITEDYVSFEVAKLLKEKGFNEKCRGCYLSVFDDFDNPVVVFEEWTTQLYNNDFVDEGFLCSAPTLQMVMKWLREVHKIGIFPCTYTFTNAGGTEEYHPYGTAIINLVTYELMTDDIMPRNSYEQAVESAIKYCLENLI